MPNRTSSIWSVRGSILIKSLGARHLMVDLIIALGLFTIPILVILRYWTLPIIAFRRGYDFSGGETVTALMFLAREDLLVVAAATAISIIAAATHYFRVAIMVCYIMFLVIIILFAVINLELAPMFDS